MTHSHHMGGHVADIPAGTKRKYDDGRPRELSVSISSYIGVAPGAIHYYLMFREDGNPFVDCVCDGGEPHDHSPWDDKQGGDEWRMGFPTLYDATASFRKLVDMMDGSPKYKLVWDEDAMTEYEDEGFEELNRKIGIGNRNWVRDTYDR